MGEQIITSEQLEKLHNAFDAFDEDNDGKVECSCLEKLVRSVGFNPSADEVEDMISDLKDKPFTFNAFLYIIFRHSRCVNVEEDLIRAFRVFDKSKCGRLPVATVRSILENTRQPFTADQIDDILDHSHVKNDLVDYTVLVRAILTA
ncbi:Calmodulin [Tritrichomonas foetus]|uniref:Calmodulin n=1 Tax=Tritrichomonas foetus TaxID=1144522 RepID=A0A1J4KUX6_9EUKA|nr:Calmodulin [Tritrichomonas foetus]|eukprot:OHT15105.1 Calmodulin [Tritrichomonas foetus]